MIAEAASWLFLLPPWWMSVLFAPLIIYAAIERGPYGRPLAPIPAPDEWHDLGIRIIPNGQKMLGRNDKYRRRRFKAFFGADWGTCCELWYWIIRVGHLRWTWQAQPKHMLWALLFLCRYQAEEINCSMVGGVDIKTFWKWWSWFMPRVLRSWFRVS